MNLTICRQCAALIQRLDSSCPECGTDQVEQFANLAEGDAIYACGACQRPQLLRAEANPRNSHQHYATEVASRAKLHLPLETPNSIYLCRHCKKWNWVVLDERISSFRFGCPDCLRTSRIESLGRRLSLRGFLKPLVLGDLRQRQGRLPLRCAHQVHLARVLYELRHCGAPRPAAPKPAVSAKRADDTSASRAA